MTKPNKQLIKIKKSQNSEVISNPEGFSAAIAVQPEIIDEKFEVGG